MPRLRALACLTHLCCFACVLLSAPAAQAQAVTLQGLRSTAGKGSFRAAQITASGNLVLLYDQGDGLRLLETDSTAQTVLRQVHLGAVGDTGIALTQGSNGDLYVVGTSRSGTLSGTPGSAFPAPADLSLNSFLASFDANLNPVFLTFLGSGRTSATAVAASNDAVFITGTTYATTLPVSAAAVQPSATAAVAGTGFVERLSTDGAHVVYATYLGGALGPTQPAGITVDTSGRAIVAGQTSASDFPTTTTALQPRLLGSTSGFLTQLSATGDAFVFSTFVAGNGLTGIAFDPASNTLLATGNIDPGAFPLTRAANPIAPLPYQAAIRFSLDAQTVLASTLLAPGDSSLPTLAPGGTAWLAGHLTLPLFASVPGSGTTGDSYLLHLAADGSTDAVFRFGASAANNIGYATVATLPGPAAVTTDGATAFLPSTLSATAAATFFSTQAFDLPLTAPPSTALPTQATDLTSAACSGPGSCTASAGLLGAAQLHGTSPVLALSTGTLPNLTLRNLGPVAAASLAVTAPGYNATSNCGTALASQSVCGITLAGSGPGTLTVTASNAPPLSMLLPAGSRPADPLAIGAPELDFGIITSSASRSVNVAISNLAATPQSFASQEISSAHAPTYSLEESGSTCAGTPTHHLMPASGHCTVTLALSASADSAADGPVVTTWLLGTHAVHVTGYAQASSLALSAGELSFGVRYQGLTPPTPRFLYLSNASSAPAVHAPVTLPTGSPFQLTDRCPSLLPPGSVCALEFTYAPAAAPADDSTTLTLDNGLSVLIDGITLPASAASAGASAVTLAPESISFEQPVIVTQTSTEIQPVTLTNTGSTPLAITLSLAGDFTETGNCGGTLGAGASCIVLVHFTPTQTGLRQGLLTLTSPGGARYLSLTANALPLVLPSGNTLILPSSFVGEPVTAWLHAQSAIPSLSTAVIGNGFSVSLVPDVGGSHSTANAAAFASSVTGDCADCWIAVQYLAQQPGPAAGTLTLTSGTGTNAQVFSLSAAALPLQGVVLTPASTDFGSIPFGSASPAATFTLANLTSPPQPVEISTINVSGDFTLLPNASGGPSCTGTLASTASCFLQIAFLPTTGGLRVGTLSLTTSTGTVTAELQGNGSPASPLAIVPAALDFTNMPGPAATQQTLSLTNTGTTPLSLAQPFASNPAFSIAGQCALLAPGASCSFCVRFTPAEAQLAATLTIPVTAGGQSSTYTVALTGGYTRQQSGLLLLPAQASFGTAAAGMLGATRQFTVVNTSFAATSLAVQVPRNFALAVPLPCPTLAPGAACTFAVTLTPAEAGPLTGSLILQATAPNSAVSQAISYLSAYSTGTSSRLNIIGTSGGAGTVSFGQVASGQSAQQTLIVSNPGPTALHIGRISTAPPFYATSTCADDLAPSASCTVHLTYAPIDQLSTTTTASLMPRTDAGLLTIESDAASSPDTLNLNGSVLPQIAATVSGTQPVATYSLSTQSLTFREILSGQRSAPQQLTLTNTGTVALHFNPPAISAAFTVTTDCGTLRPAATCSLIVILTPAADNVSAVQNGLLKISSDAADPLDFVTLLGTIGGLSVTLTPAPADFPATLIGSSSAQTFTLTNVGPLPVQLAGFTPTGPFALQNNTCPGPSNLLPAGQSCTFLVVFSPVAPGTHTGTVTVSSGLSIASVSLALTGSAPAPQVQASAATLNFGSVQVGHSATLPLTMHLLNSTAIPNLASSFEGASATDFSVAGSCAADALTPATCTLQVVFTPSAILPRAATLVLSAAGVASPVEVVLSGTGIQAAAIHLTTPAGATSATASIGAGTSASIPVLATPSGGFTGEVALRCAALTASPYMTCTVSPGTVDLTTGAQSATVTIGPSSLAAGAAGLPLGLLSLCTPLLLRRRRNRTAPNVGLLPAGIFALLGLTCLLGCGGPGSRGQPLTPPGSYSFQVKASAVNAPALTSSITLNVVLQ